MADRAISALKGNSQRLDGGAMFGNAPREVWSRWIEPDGRNRIPLACRSMLVRDAGRVLLFEAGVGAFFEPRLRERYGVVEPGHVLRESLADEGLSDRDVDVVVLSHLHFDHAGGLLAAWSDGAEPELLFSNARYVVSQTAWDRATAPHARDRASFVPILNRLLEESGRLALVDRDDPSHLGSGFRFHVSEGHTPGLLLTEVDMPSGPVLFAADLVPGSAWVHLPITMGYDRHPELLVDEKRVLFDDLLRRRGRLFFTHDPTIALGRLARDDRGRYGLVETTDAVRDLRA